MTGTSTISPSRRTETSMASTPGGWASRLGEHVADGPDADAVDGEITSADSGSIRARTNGPSRT